MIFAPIESWGRDLSIGSGFIKSRTNIERATKTSKNHDHYFAKALQGYSSVPYIIDINWVEQHIGTSDFQKQICRIELCDHILVARMWPGISSLVLPAPAGSTIEDQGRFVENPCFFDFIPISLSFSLDLRIYRFSATLRPVVPSISSDSASNHEISLNSCKMGIEFNENTVLTIPS